MADSHGADESPDWISIGYISRPHGLRGAVFLVADDRRREFGEYSRVRLELRSEVRVVRVLSSYVSAGQPVLALEGVSSREEAEGLLRARVSVPREEAIGNSSDNEGEEAWLVADLVGLSVVDVEKGPIGEIVAVHNFGAQENLEVRLPGRKETVLLPFIDAFVERVDRDAREVRVRNASEFLEES